MRIERTADGSATLYVPELDEHYHSVAGALTESRHVYLECGLAHRAAMSGGPVRILEYGLGTGLDAILAWQWARRNGRRVCYTGLELYPVPAECIGELGLPDEAMAHEIHTAPWETDCGDEFFTFRKVCTDFTDYCPGPGVADVIFYDAFAPDKQPALWSPEHLAHVAHLLAPGGVLTTYCAKGAVRRALASSGLVTERLHGPPGGKREILRATKPNTI